MEALTDFGKEVFSQKREKWLCLLLAVQRADGFLSGAAYAYPEEVRSLMIALAQDCKEFTTPPAPIPSYEDIDERLETLSQIVACAANYINNTFLHLQREEEKEGKHVMKEAMCVRTFLDNALRGKIDVSSYLPTPELL